MDLLAYQDYLKQGLFTGDAVDYCGEILFDDLNIPPEIFTQVNHSAKRLTHKPLAARLKNTHKGNFGHLLIISGDGLAAKQGKRDLLSRDLMPFIKELVN